MPIEQDLTREFPGTLIELYTLDLSPISESAQPFYFHSGLVNPGQNIDFQGITYLPMPIEVEGFEASGQGRLPRPKLRVANVDGIISAAIAANDDLIGAKLIRRRTLSKYLDDGEAPDPTAEWRPEIWFVERKLSETRSVVEFELASSMDVHGVRLPRRQIITATCPFVYEEAGSCGYTDGKSGTQGGDPNFGGMFTDADLPTTDPAEDKCAKKFNSCLIRFDPDNENVPLPFGGFLGTRGIPR